MEKNIWTRLTLGLCALALAVTASAGRSVLALEEPGEEAAVSTPAPTPETTESAAPTETADSEQSEKPAETEEIVETAPPAETEPSAAPTETPVETVEPTEMPEPT